MARDLLTWEKDFQTVHSGSLSKHVGSMTLPSIHGSQRTACRPIPRAGPAGLVARTLRSTSAAALRHAARALFYTNQPLSVCLSLPERHLLRSGDSCSQRAIGWRVVAPSFRCATGRTLGSEALPSFVAYAGTSFSLHMSAHGKTSDIHSTRHVIST